MTSLLRLPASLLLALLILGAAFPAASQSQYRSEYVVEYEATLSGTQGILSIQIPSGNLRNLIPHRVAVRCPQDCKVSQLRDATVTGGSAATIKKLNPNAAWVPATTATSVSAPSVAGGTTLLSGEKVLANTQVVLEVSGVILESGAGAARNYVVTTTAVTGEVRIAIIYEERTNL